MEVPVVSQDLEVFDPEVKLKNDEEQGINIETISLSGNDSDLEETEAEDNDMENMENIEDTTNPIEKLKNDVKLVEPEEDGVVISENLGIKLNEDNSSNYSTDSDEDSDTDYYENMKKIDQDINKDILFDYHPETKQINYKELLTLSNVVKNKKGDIIDPLHKTIPFLTCYEKAKILGMRAKQINNGSIPFVDVPKNIIDGHTIAFMELNKKKIPFIIRRPIPNGGSEYWKVSDLKILE